MHVSCQVCSNVVLSLKAECWVVPCKMLDYLAENVIAYHGCVVAGLYITYPHDKRNAKKVGLSETLLEGALLK